MPCMFDQVFDMSDVYAIVTRFYLEQYFRDRRLLYPNVTEGMLRSNRYWQPKTISENDTAIRDYFLENPDKKDYVSTRFLECMGVDVVGTMKEVGIELKFPPGEIVYRIAFVAKAYEDVLEKYDFEVFEPKTDKKNGIRTLIKKR